MASNTKLLQAMADAMLPLFGDMPRVMLTVKDSPAFLNDPQPLAVYDSPNIVVNPNHPPTSSFNDLKSTICHELIHAWLHWTGLDHAGEFLDDYHNEWFVKKALEINKLNLDGLKVDVEYLLTTPEAVQIYNRLAGTSRLPHRRDETQKDNAGVTNELDEIFRLPKNVYSIRVVIILFLVVIASLFFNKAPAGFVWGTWAIAALVWTGFEFWKELRSRRLSGKNTFQKRAKSEIAAQAEPFKRHED